MTKERYLIAEKTSLQGSGYIELNYENPKMPDLEIAILEEYQRKGYAFASNKASCRIAEKLGGVLVQAK